jgi:hypothetical protein
MLSTAHFAIEPGFKMGVPATRSCASRSRAHSVSGAGSDIALGRIGLEVLSDFYWVATT